MSGEAESFPLVRMSPPLQLPAPFSRFCVCNLKRKQPHNANRTNSTNRPNGEEVRGVGLSQTDKTTLSPI